MFFVDFFKISDMNYFITKNVKKKQKKTKIVKIFKNYLAAIKFNFVFR
jgi:hypothetical protein